MQKKIPSPASILHLLWCQNHMFQLIAQECPAMHKKVLAAAAAEYCAGVISLQSVCVRHTIKCSKDSLEPYRFDGMEVYDDRRP